MFLFQGLPHYYNYVLNRLDAIPGMELVNVVPRDPTNIGAGVFQTHEDIQYRLYELDEYAAIYGGFFFRGLWSLLLKERPDIVVATDAQIRGFICDLPTFAVMRWLGIRLIMKSIPFRVPVYAAAKAEILADYRRRRADAPLWKAPWLAIRQYWMRMVNLQAQRVSWQHPDAHVNYTEEAYEIYGSYGVPKDRIFITYNSPDTDRLLAVHDQLVEEGTLQEKRQRRLIHVGRLVEWKRVDLLLRAVAELSKKYRDVELLVIGEGPKREEWETLARSLRIGDKVQFLGGVYDPSVLGRHLMSSAIYVLPGMGGLSINEAMCFGMPTVCSVCDGTEKYLVRDGENGLFFENGNAEDLASKIDRLFTHPQTVAEMGARSLRIIREQMNINTVIRGYILAFEHVTGTNLSGG